MLVQTSTTSKPNNLKKKTSITEDQYKDMLENNLGSRLYAYQNSGKKITSQVETSLAKKVKAMIDSEYRVKGSRVSNISLADQETQERWAGIKSDVEATKFTGSDGKNYVGSCMIKEVK